MKAGKRILRFLVMFIIFGIAAFFLTTKGDFSYFANYTKYEEISSMDELTERIIKNIENGNKVAYFSIPEEIEKDKIKNLNRELDGFFGYVDTYQLEKNYFQKKEKLTVDFQISINYFVIRKFKSGKFPKDTPQKAKVLYRKVKNILDEIIKENMTEYEKEKAIHDYIIRHGAYEQTGIANKDNDSYHAYGLLVNGKGVCNAYAEAMHLLLKIAGVESQIIFGTADGEEHAWNLIELNGKWYQTDATWDDPVPDRKNRVQYAYFNVTDDVMKQRHTWNTLKYPQCSAVKYNYYRYNKKVCSSYESLCEKVMNVVSKHKEEQISFLIKNYSEKKYDLSFIYKDQEVRKVMYSVTQHGDDTILDLEIKYR